MRCRLLLSYLAPCGMSLVTAQPNPNANASLVEPLPPIFAPRAPAKETKFEGASRPVSSPPHPRRAISPEMAAKLSAAVTRLASSSSAKSSENIAPTASRGDSSEVVQLKPYVVLEDRLPRLKERDLLTPKGKLALARRRYPGLGPLSSAAALRLLEEDFAAERRQEMAELGSLLEIGGAKPSRHMKRKINEASMRPSGLPR